MVPMTILKPLQFYLVSVVSLGKMSGGGAPVSLEFCHRDASAVVSIPVALNFGFAVNLIHSF